jgi:hypothetical protein
MPVMRVLQGEEKMTMESTTSAEASVNAEVDLEASEVTSEVDDDSKADSDIDSDQSETYEQWLARQNKMPPKKTSGDDSKKAPKMEKAEPKIPESKENGKTEPKEQETGTKRQEPEAPAKIKLKDKEYTQDELIKEFDTLREGSSKLQELQQQAEQLVELLKTDPGRILGKIGANREAIEKWYYETHIAPEMLTPEQRQAKADSEELAQYRAQNQQLEQERAERQQQELKSKYQKEFTDRINEALDTAGLPKTDWTLQRAANYLKQGYQAGNKEISAADAVNQVKQDWIELQKSVVSKMSPEELANHLGEDTLSKLRARDVEQFKNKAFEPKNEAPKEPRQKKEKERKRIKSPYDILENL